MGIDVTIAAGDSVGSSAVNVTGVDESHVITDDEVTTWGLDDDTLKNAVDKYFGKRPDDVFLHSPTPWHDLYKKYDWKQVTTTVTLHSAQVVSVDLAPIALVTRHFPNDSSVPVTFTTSLTDQVTDMVQTSWTSKGTVTVGQTVKYEVKALGTGVEGTTKLEFAYEFGVGGTNTAMTMLGTNTGVTLTLQPGQAVDAVLSARRGTLTVEVVYDATLSGLVAVNYADSFKDHHFWGLDVGSILDAAGIDKTKSFTTTITFDYYSDVSVSVTDAKTGEHVALDSPLALPGA